MPNSDSDRKCLPVAFLPAVALGIVGLLALILSALTRASDLGNSGQGAGQNLLSSALGGGPGMLLAFIIGAIAAGGLVRRRVRKIEGDDDAAGEASLRPDLPVRVESGHQPEPVPAAEVVGERHGELTALLTSDVLPIAYFASGGQLTKANAAFLNLSGYSPEDIERGEVTRSSLCPPDRVAESIYLHDDHAGRRSAWIETELLAKDGSRVPVIVTVKVLPGDDFQTVLIAVDVSGFRRTNAALWRRAEIEHQIATLSVRLISLPCDEIDEAIEEGLAEFGKIFGAHGCATFLFDPDSRQLHKCYEWQSRELVASGQEVLLSEAVLHALEKLRVGDCIHSYRVPALDSVASEGGAASDILCETAVPLLSGGNLAGVLSIQSFRSNSANTDEGLTLLRLLAQTLANGVERVCADQALRRSEQTKDAVWQVSLDAIFVMDASGRILEWNPAAEKIFGYTAEEIVGSLFDEKIIPAELQESHQTGLQRTFRGRQARHSGTRSEIVAQRSDGGRFPCELSIIPMSEEGSGSHFIGTARDITERRQADERLKASQLALQRAAEQTRVVLDSLPARVALFAGDGSIVATNRAWSHSPLPEWMKPGNAMAADAPSPVLARVLDVASGKDHGFSVEYASRAEDHVKRWSRVTVSALGPHSMGAVVMHLDITEHQLAIEALADSEERYRSVVENVREAIFSLSPSGHLICANPAVTTITGHPVDSLRGKHFAEFLSAASTTPLKMVLRSILAGEEPDAFVVRVQHAEGQMLELECTVVPQFVDGSLVSILGVARDVTERNKTEERSRQVERMLSIGQLAAGVAHDFNNILTIQQGYASELRGVEDLPAKAREALTEITAAGERAALLTRKLLTFGGKQSMQPKLLNVMEFLAGMGPRIERLLGDDVACTLQATPGLPPIYLDPEMLDQVISNVVANSHDSMPDGGALVISLDDLVISEATAKRNPEARAGHFVRITITDSGCGISPENLPHIFEPFFTTKDVARGAGLGLATVHGIVKQNAGWIEVESRVHSGSSFRIYFRAAVGFDDIPVATPTQKSPAARGNSTILLVEDETQLCTVVAHDLRRRGYNVLAAGSGAEALELWSKHGPDVDLLLTDLVMPEGMTGQELAERLLRLRPDLKVLYTSGYSSDIAGKNLSLQPGSNFLAKPYQPAGLANAVQNCLGQS